MNAEEYYKGQDLQKKLFELAYNEEMKQKIFEEMMAAEMDFLGQTSNLTPETTEVNGSFITLLEAKEKASESGYQPDITGSIKFEKITPENFFSRTTAKDSKGNDASTVLEDLQKENPEAFKRLCDGFNLAILAKIKNELPVSEQGQYKIVEDEKYLGLQKIRPDLEYSAKEVTSIVERAEGFKALEENAAPESKIEEKEAPSSSMKLN